MLSILGNEFYDGLLFFLVGINGAHEIDMDLITCVSLGRNDQLAARGYKGLDGVENWIHCCLAV